MGERSTWIALVLLAVLAALTQWLVWINRPADAGLVVMGPPRSDYTLERFELDVLDTSGQLAFAVIAPRLVRHPYDGSLSIAAPTFSLSDGGGGRWSGAADAALVNSDASTLLLEGAVQLARPAVGDEQAIKIEAKNLLAFPKERRAESAEFVTITRPGSILRGRGLKADFQTQRMELLADVTARFEPQPDE